MKYRKRSPPAHPNLDFRWGTGEGSSVSNKLSWPFEYQLSLKKGGAGGANPLDQPLFIFAFLLLYFYYCFFLQQVILLFATRYELVKGSFFTVELLGN